MPQDLISNIPTSLEVRMKELLAPDEIIEVKLRGQAKEALVCTDRRVLILKTGFMTGSMFGSKLFQTPYRNITGVEVDFSFLFGVFELMTGGNQYSRKSAWRSHGSNANASEAPNAIGLNTSAQADLFRRACSHILMRVDKAQGGSALPTSRPSVSVADEVRKLAALRDEGLLTPEEFEIQKRIHIGDVRAPLDIGGSLETLSDQWDQDDLVRTGTDAAIQRALNARSRDSEREAVFTRSGFGRRATPPR